MKIHKGPWAELRDNATFIGRVEGDDMYRHFNNYFRMVGENQGQWVLLGSMSFENTSDFDQRQLDFCLAHRAMIS